VKKEAIILLAIAAANTGITQRVAEPMLAELAARFGSTVPAVASVITAFAFASAGAQYFHGAFGDRFGKLRIVTLLTGLSAITSIGCALASGLQGLLVWRFLAGLFASGTMTLGMAYLADVVPAGRRQVVLARFLTGSITGQAMGPFVGGLLTDVVGWRWTFVFLGAVFSVVAVILFMRTRAVWNEGPRSTGPLLSPTRYTGILRLPRARGVLVAVFLEMMLFFGAFSFVGALLRERFDLPFTLIGLVLAGYGLGGLAYAASARWLLHHFGQRGCVALGGGLGGAFYLGVVVAPAWSLVLLCTVGLGFSFYTMHNTLQLKATEMAPRERGSALALFSMGWAGGQAVGVSVMGAGVAMFGYGPMLAGFGIGFACLGFILQRELHRL
jgi:predicted MFS family arabinose efflux permease